MTPESKIIRYVRAARGLEAGGYYAAARLLWALTYAEEIRASSALAIPRGEALIHNLETIRDELQADPAALPEVVTALERSLTAIRADQPVTYADVPAIYVSRTCGDLFMGEPPHRTRCNDDPLALREFPAIWYLELLPPAQAIDALREFPAMLSEVLDSLTADQMLIPEAPGEWSMRELLRHYYLSQELIAGRVEQVLTETNPTLKGLAIWNDPDDPTISTGQLLDQYQASRAALLAKLEVLPAEAWWRPCFHSEYGPMTLLHQVTFFARHERTHMPQMWAIYRAATGLGGDLMDEKPDTQPSR